MRTYLLDLVYTVLGTFLATLAGIAAAAEPFDLFTFSWGAALGTSGSAAALVLLHGLAARFQGDPDRARFTAPKQ